MRTRSTSVISFLMVTVLVLGALLTSCASEKKESPAAKYLNKIFEATFAGVEAPEPQVTTSKISFNNTNDLGIPHFVGAEMTLVTGTNGESASFADITLDSGKVDLSVYNAGMTCIFGSNAIGETKYGIELTDIGMLLGYFIPAYPSPAPDTTLPQESVSASGLLGMLSGADSLLGAINEMNIYPLIAKYAQIIADAADSTCESDVDTTDGVTVNVEFNTDSAKKLIKDVFAELKKDKDVKNIVGTILVSSGMSDIEVNEKMSAIFSEEYVQNVYDMLDAYPFTVKVEVNANADCILNGASFTIKSQGTTTKVFFNAAEEGKVEVGVSSSVVFEGVSYKQETKLVFENKTVDGAETFSVGLVTKVDDAAHVETLFNAEVKDGKYAVTVFVPAEQTGVGYYDITFKGETKTEGNKITTTLTSVDAFDNTISVDLKVETEVGGTLPTFPTEFKSIVEVTGDEFNAILNNLKNSPLGQFIPEGGSEIVLPDVEY